MIMMVKRPFCRITRMTLGEDSSRVPLEGDVVLGVSGVLGVADEEFIFFSFAERAGDQKRKNAGKMRKRKRDESPVPTGKDIGPEPETVGLKTLGQRTFPVLRRFDPVSAETGDTAKAHGKIIALVTAPMGGTVTRRGVTAPSETSGHHR